MAALAGAALPRRREEARAVGVAAVRPGLRAALARLARLRAGVGRGGGHERLLEAAAVLLADIALVTRQEDHALLRDDLRQRNRLPGVVGLGDHQDVHAVGGDVALEVLRVAGRVAV